MTDAPRTVGRARMMISRAVSHSVDGEPVRVAYQLSRALRLLEGVVDESVWYRVAGAKILHCRGDDAAARAELREVMDVLDAEVQPTIVAEGAEPFGGPADD